MDKKKKIVYCIDCLARGGTELQLAGLIDHLDRDLFEPVLCTLRPSPPELTPADCSHWDLDVPRLLNPAGVSAMWNLSRRMKAQKVEIVQTFFQDSTIFGGTAARLAGVPVRLACFRDLGFWRSPLQENMLRLVYPMMTHFLANSQAVKRHFASRDRIPPEKIQVIPNGTDVAGLSFVPQGGPTVEIGIVGNLNRPVKRVDLFIEAAGMVAADHPETIWHILGDGSLRGGLEEQANRAGLEDRVKFAGRVADIPQYLGRIQVGVNCSDSEGFSNAVIEYMLKGCAVVATDNGGNAEAIVQNETGLLIPPDDPQALAAALRRLVEDVPFRMRLAENARRYAEAQFSWEACVGAHEALYGGHE